MRRAWAAAIALAACRSPDVSVGARLPAVDAHPADGAESCAPTVVPFDRLPFGLVDATSLPAAIDVGGRRFVRGFFETFDATANGVGALGSALVSGAGAYPVSLSEFGPEALSSAEGRLRLTVAPKPAADGGATDRAYWGAEVLSARSLPHGIFVARLRAAPAPQLVLSFFVTHEKFDPSGVSLGWTGPLFNFGADPTTVDAVFHDSASGRHESVPVAMRTDVDHVYALLAEPQHVALFIDGMLAHEWRDAETASPWILRITNWIVAPEAAAFDDGALPRTAEVDFLAAYALDGCR